MLNIQNILFSGFHLVSFQMYYLKSEGCKQLETLQSETSATGANIPERPFLYS